MKKTKTSAFRHRKHIPYGSKGYCGYGGEFYSAKHNGFYITDIVDKKQERKKNKMTYIMKDEENKNLNDSAWKEDTESDPDMEEDDDEDN